MLAIADALQVGGGLAADTLGAEVGPALDRLDDADRDRLTFLVEGGHVDRERGLQARATQELLQDDAGVRIGLEVDDDADLHLLGLAVLGRLIADVLHFRHGWLGARLGLRIALAERRVGDVVHQTLSRQAERDRRNDDAVTLATVLRLLDRQLGAHFEATLARGVRRRDVGAGADESAGRKVRAGHDRQQLRQFGFYAAGHALEDVLRCERQLRCVVRRDLRGEAHADRATGHAVQQEHRNLHRHDRGLGQSAVVVRRVRYCTVVNAVQHQPVGHRFQLRLGVARSCRTRTVDRTHVAVAVDERDVVLEVAGHAGHGVVHRSVAVGVEVTERVADDLGALHGGTRRRSGRLGLIQQATVDRLETVPRVRDGPRVAGGCECAVLTAEEFRQLLVDDVFFEFSRH